MGEKEQNNLKVPQQLKMDHPSAIFIAVGNNYCEFKLLGSFIEDRERQMVKSHYSDAASLWFTCFTLLALNSRTAHNAQVFHFGNSSCRAQSNQMYMFVAVLVVVGIASRKYIRTHTHCIYSSSQCH